ncbi:MAG: hypothetical protein J6X62_04350 [Bacteroidales bacterium]|nr:hypothetical protein [Bacteroidales bacterium]
MKKLLSSLFLFLTLGAIIANAQQRNSQTLQYDNNTYNTGIGGDNGLFLWAVKFDASQIASYQTLDSVKVYGVTTTAAEYFVYQGQNIANTGTFLYRQSVTITAGVWNTYALSTPLTLNTSQPLWIVFKARHSIGVAVAAACVGTNANAAWYNEDTTASSSWKNIVNEGYSYNWMMRASVSAPGAAATYTITANCDPSKGIVTGGGTYTDGDTAVLTARPIAGYVFLDWQDGNTANPRRVVVHSNMTFTANFAEDEVESYTVTVTCDPSRGTVTGGGVYTAGSTATLTASPYAGYHFTSWSDGSADNPRSLIVNRDISLSATFASDNGEGIGETASAQPIVALTQRTLTVSNASGLDVAVYDIEGRVIAQHSNAPDGFTTVFTHPGVYLVRIGDSKPQKLLVR